MSDPNPAVAEPVSAPASEPLALAELFPVCFDWEHPRPFKIGLH